MNLFAMSAEQLAALLAAMAVLIYVLLRRSHRYLRKQKRNDSYLVKTARPEEKKPAHNLDAPSEILRWEVQMHETARELSAQLDSKMIALQHLIADAEDAIERLEEKIRELDQ